MARTSTPPPRPHPKSPSPRRGPHPLTPSPQRGEGERKVSSSSPLSRRGRGTGGEDSKGGQAGGIRRTQKVSFTPKLLAWWARPAPDLPSRHNTRQLHWRASAFLL